MPRYEYLCFDHGRFEKFWKMSEYGTPTRCPVCEGIATKVMPHLSIRVKNKKQQRHGTGAESTLVPQTGEAPGYFIYSEGGMEQEEMDYIKEAQAEKAKNYKRKTPKQKIHIGGDKYGNYEVDVKEQQ